MPARYDGIIVQSVGGFARPIALVCPMLATEFFHHWRTIAEVMSTSEKRRSNRGDGWSASRVLLLGSLANALAIEFIVLRVLDVSARGYVDSARSWRESGALPCPGSWSAFLPVRRAAIQ